MTRKEARATEIAVLALQQQLEANPKLHAEVQRARRQFFGNEADARERRGDSDAGEHRFAEWFVLERDSEVLGAVPVAVPALAEQVKELLGSLVGAFHVTLAAKNGVEARDLQDGEDLELVVPSETLRPGDLLVGRLFPLENGQWIPSSSAAVFRPGEEIGLAFQRDYTRLELDRRLQQVELEHLLLRRADQTPSPTAGTVAKVPLEHLEADLDRLLDGSGSKYSAAEVSELLAEAGNPGPVMGPLLDDLAFDTAVDLDRARELLLQIWNSYHEGDKPKTAAAEGAGAEPLPPGETLGERLVRTLDEGLSRKRDVGEVFAQLERLAGIDPEADDDGDDNPFDRGEEEDDGEPAERPADGARIAEDEHDDDEDDRRGDEVAAGDVGPLVEEYLWEAGIDTPEVGATLRMWVGVQGNAALPHIDLVDVTGQDLMRFLLHVYLGAAPECRAEEVRASFGTLQGFFAWAERTQEMELASVVQACRGSLLDHLDRLATASQALSSPPDRSRRPGILQVEDLGPTGFGVRDDDGGDHWLQATAQTVAALQKGDLVLGTLVPHGNGSTLAGLVVVLPADARSLME